jgi:hypothetical protein
MIVFPFTVNITFGQRPASADIPPVVSTAVEGAGAGAGDGVGLLVAEDVTTTVVVQLAVAPTLSLALQATAVEPTGKSEPDGGEQLVLIGATPPPVVTAKLTTTGEPLVDMAVGAGHVIASGLLVGAIPATSADGGLMSSAASYDCTTK